MVADRINIAMATEATLLQMAVSSLFAKKSADEFKKVIERLTGDG